MPETVSSKSPARLIFLTVLIDMIGFGMIIPILPLYGKMFAATEFQIGILVAIYSLVQFFSGPILGLWSDRIGRRPILVLSLLGTAVGFFIMGAAHTLALLFLARALSGFTGGNISTAQAYIADITPPEKRAKGMGMIGAAFGLGFVFGPAMGALLSQHDLHWGSVRVPAIAVPLYFAGLMALFNTVAVYFRLPESLPPERRAQPVQKKTRQEMWGEVGGEALGKVLATYLVAIIGFSIFTTAFALFTLHRFHFTAADNGYTFAAVGVIGVIIQGGLIGRLTKKYGGKTLASLGAIGLAAGFFLLPLASSLAMLCFANGLIAIGNSLINPSLNALASQSTGPQHQGSALGLMSSAGSLARTIGPVLCGWLLTLDLHRGADHYGHTAFWTASGLMLGATALTFFIKPVPQTLAPLVAEPV